MPAFRISGGLLLFLIAVDMLFERRSDRRERRATENPPDPSVFPLAMPLIAGPGALATMVLLSSQHAGDLGALVGIHVVMLLVLGDDLRSSSGPARWSSACSATPASSW